MRKEEIDKLSKEELKSKLDEIKKKYLELKMSHKVNPIENPLQIRIKRRLIAKLHTAISKRNEHIFVKNDNKKDNE